MASNNSISLIGRIGQTPEAKRVGADHEVVDISIAVNRGFKDENGEYISDWVPIKIWDKKADFILKYAKKGSLIAVSGTLRVDKWNDDHGNKKNKTYVQVESVQVLDKKEESESGTSNRSNFNSPSKKRSSTLDQFEDMSDEEAGFVPPF